MRLPKLFRVRKSRKYPILKDEHGDSLRVRCFKLFKEGKGPTEVIKELGAKRSSVQTYHRDWKRLGPNFKQEYDFLKNTMFSKDSEDREHNMESLSRVFGISKEELEEILLKPSGLRRLLTGKIRFPAHEDVDRKKRVALQVGVTISDYLLHHRGKVEDLLFAFDRWMKYTRGRREEWDADVEEENKEMSYTRQILEAAAIAESKGRPKRDWFTEEESAELLKFATELKAKKMQSDLAVDYFNRITDLMSEGLTEEQAREKIYQDLIDKGSVEGAKKLREYQDKVHPLKSDKQSKQTPPSQPPQAT